MWPLATRALNCMWRGNLIHLSWMAEMHLTLAPRGNVDKSFRLRITLDSINFTWRGAAVWLMCQSRSLRSAVWLEASTLRFLCDGCVSRLIQTCDFSPLEKQTACICQCLFFTSFSPLFLLILLDLEGHQQQDPSICPV